MVKHGSFLYSHPPEKRPPRWGSKRRPWAQQQKAWASELPLRVMTHRQWQSSSVLGRLETGYCVADVPRAINLLSLPHSQFPHRRCLCTPQNIAPPLMTATMKVSDGLGWRNASLCHPRPLSQRIVIGFPLVITFNVLQHNRPIVGPRYVNEEMSSFAPPCQPQLPY